MPGKILLAAVSGGADSAAMLVSLSELRTALGFSLHCIHVEHGLRPPDESRGDARAVQELCKTFSVPCRIVSVPPGRIKAFSKKHRQGIEAAARYFRYRIFSREKTRINADYVLTAHNRNDVLENILIRILRGSGPSGLGIIPKNRGYLLRPLLDFSRDDILEYLKEKGVSYRNDATNTDTAFFRNKVRLLLVPFLNIHFPGWQKSLYSLGETQSLLAEFLSDEINNKFNWEPEGRGFNSALKLDENNLSNVPQILKEEVIFSGIDKLMNNSGIDIKIPLKPPRRSAVRKAIVGDFTGDLGQARLEKKNSSIYLRHNRKAAVNSGFALLIKKPGIYTLKCSLWNGTGDLRLTVSRNSIELSGDKPEKSELGKLNFKSFPLVLSMGGHKRPISDILNARDHSSGIIHIIDSNGILGGINV